MPVQAASSVLGTGIVRKWVLECVYDARSNTMFRFVISGFVSLPCYFPWLQIHLYGWNYSSCKTL